MEQRYTADPFLPPTKSTTMYRLL